MHAFAAVVATSFLLADVAAAATQRAFVSTAGSDANAASNCGLTAPCRSFDAAIGVVSSNGEVIALDSGGYGRFTVTKSVTVSAPPGVYAGISVFSGTNGVDIDAAGVHVVLRGLSINGQGGTHGIHFQNGASLAVENCTIGSMNGSGIRITAAGASNAFPALASIVGTSVTRSVVGIHVADGPASVTISRSTVTDNDIGINARATLAGVENAVSVSDTVSSNNNNGLLVIAEASGATVGGYVDRSTFTTNSSNGIYSESVAGGTAFVTAAGNLVARNFNGVSNGGQGAAKTVIGHNTVSRNRQLGLAVVQNATMLSRGDNVVNDNAVSDVLGTLGAIAGQ